MNICESYWPEQIFFPTENIVWIKREMFRGGRAGSAPCSQGLRPSAQSEFSSSTERYEQRTDIPVHALFFFKIVFITIVRSSKLYGWVFLYCYCVLFSSQSKPGVCQNHKLRCEHLKWLSVFVLIHLPLIGWQLREVCFEFIPKISF